MRQMYNHSYDAADNPLGDGTATFTWNAAGKLSTTIKNAKTHNYKYNALDQRISKNGPLSPKYFFFYDPAGQLIGEYKDNAATTTPTDDWLLRQETVWLDDIPVAVLRKPVAANPIQIAYIHADHLNTPRLIVNTNNTPVWRWDNVHAFGANLPDEDPDGNSQLFEYNPRFPGQYFDKETALHYNYFRYYEPETGRYISPDPIGLAGGVNVYGYVENDPISWIDPDGLVRNRGNSNPRSIVPNPGNRPGGWSYGQFYPSIGNAPPRTANYPVGSSRSQFQVPPKAQQSGGNVCGRDFSGHAFDQMQARGIMPTVVENTLKTGQSFPTRLGTSGFYDPINNIRVITNSETGRIVTVIPGTP